MSKVAVLAISLVVLGTSTESTALSPAGLKSFRHRRTTARSRRQRSWLDRAKSAVRGFVKQFKMSVGIGVKPGGPLARIPAIGRRAPSLPLRASGRPRVVTFLRHVGCPFAEATARALRVAAQAHPAIEWVAVTHSPRSIFRKWTRDIGGLPRVKVITDTPRRRYAQFGLGITGVGHFLGPAAMSALLRLARQGIRNRLPENGTRFQMAGTFGLDSSGIVRWRHIPVHGGDLPSFGKVAAALR